MSLKEKEEEAFGIVRDAFAEALGMDAEKVTPKTTVESAGGDYSEVQHVLIQIEEELDLPSDQSLEDTDAVRLKLTQVLSLARIDAQTFTCAVLEVLQTAKLFEDGLLRSSQPRPHFRKQPPSSFKTFLIS